MIITNLTKKTYIFSCKRDLQKRTVLKVYLNPNAIVDIDKKMLSELKKINLFKRLIDERKIFVEGITTIPKVKAEKAEETTGAASDDEETTGSASDDEEKTDDILN